MSDGSPQVDFWRTRWREGRTPWDLGAASDPAKRLAERHLRAPGAVFIPGCGRGHEAVYLAAQGHAVTAVDIVEEPIAELRQAAAARGLTIEALAQDLFAMPASRTGAFDAVLEQTCMAAIGPERFADYAALLHRLLKPGGKLLGVWMEVAVKPPPFTCPPGVILKLFGAPLWTMEAFEPVLPHNPARPGPEYTVVFVKQDA
jgi:SAM-dependent methyltransferase